MANITSSCTFKEAVPQMGLKIIKVETPATADTSDTLTLTLADYGLKSIEAVQGFVHTTTDSVIVEEAPTTAVSGGVLTITIGGSTVTNKKRVYIIYGDSD